MTQELAKDDGSIPFGFLICWGLNILEASLGAALFFPNVVMLKGLGAVLVYGIGLVQWAYIVPLYRARKRNGEPDTAKGMIIAASITTLLSAACWGFVMSLSP